MLTDEEILRTSALIEDASKVKRYTRFGGLTHQEYIKAQIQYDERKMESPPIPKNFERWLNRQVKRQSHGLPVEEWKDDAD